MSLALPSHSNIQISPTGLDVLAPLTFEEWSQVASSLGNAARGIAFVIGDWLVYGEANFRKGPAASRVATDAYDAAIQTTGLDRSTLHNYAYVARRVARSRRNDALAWEHHKVVAKLPVAEQRRWLALAAPKKNQRALSTMRLRKSILAGRVLTPEEMVADPADRGMKNHIPHINRLCAWWSDMKDSKWPQRATAEQVEALLRDFKWVMKIQDELKLLLEFKRRRKP
jgi:hypothetical protein